MKVFVLAHARFFSGYGAGATSEVLAVFKSKPTMNDFLTIKELMIANGLDNEGIPLDVIVENLIEFGSFNNDTFVIDEVDLLTPAKEKVLPVVDFRGIDEVLEKNAVHEIEKVSHVHIGKTYNEDGTDVESYFLSDAHAKDHEVIEEKDYETLEELLEEMEGIYFRFK